MRKRLEMLIGLTCHALIDLKPIQAKSLIKYKIQKYTITKKTKFLAETQYTKNFYRVRRI